MRYEVRIPVLDPDYIDQLIVAIARQGYSPYYNADAMEYGKDGIVCFTIAEEELEEIK